MDDLDIQILIDSIAEALLLRGKNPDQIEDYLIQEKAHRRLILNNRDA